MKKLLMMTSIALAILCIGCGKSSVDTYNGEVIELAGTPVEFDTVPGYFGDVFRIGDKYIISSSYEKGQIIVVDTTFKNPKYIVPLGDGPSEVTAIGGSAQPIGNDAFSVYNHWTLKLYKASVEDGSLEEIDDFNKDIRSCTPGGMIRLNNGHYVSDLCYDRYGLHDFDPETRTGRMWPLGTDFLDPENRISSIASAHITAYEPSRGLLCEAYIVLPLVIVHNEDGDVVKVIQIDEMPTEDELREQPADITRAISMTPNHIYILKVKDNRYTVLVYDYDFRQVAEFGIKRCWSIFVDPELRRLITTGVSDVDDEPYVMVYNIPDVIAEP